VGPIAHRRSTRSRIPRDLSLKRASAPGQVAGFTLAEVLVVLIVIGLAAGLTYARLDSDPRGELGREGRRLGAAIEHAALLAQWHNETLGVSAVGSNYRFWRRDPNNGNDWGALSGDDVLAAHALPASFAAAVRTYAARPVAADAIVPLRASGRNEPFVIELAVAEWHLLLSSDPINRVTVSPPSLR
jgi:type II secretion system protein H